MNIFKKYLISIAAGLLSLLALSITVSFPIWWLFLSVVLVWLVVSVFLYYKLYFGTEGFWYDVILLVVSQISFVGLVILVEWEFLRWLLVVLCTVFIFLLFLKLHKNKDGLSFQQKPIRRMKMMLWVFDVYAIVTTIFAISLFFPSTPFWLLAILGGVVVGAISIIIWEMYFPGKLKGFLLWSVLLTLSMVEIIWVVHLLPLGYLVLGLLVTWLWFLLQIFVRFHLMPQGIIWKKQMYFLIFNFILFFLILFFVQIVK